MDKDKKVSIDITLKEAEYLTHTRGGSFFHEQRDRFEVYFEEDEEILDLFLTYTDKDKETASMAWTDTYLEALIYHKTLRANGIEAVLLYDDCDAMFTYCVIYNLPLNINVEDI